MSQPRCGDGAPESTVPRSILAKIRRILGVNVLKVLSPEEFERMAQAASWDFMSIYSPHCQHSVHFFSQLWHPATAAQGRFVLTALHLAVTASATWQHSHVEYPLALQL